jgi:anti-sigma B factor antagonist
VQGAAIAVIRRPPTIDPEPEWLAILDAHPALALPGNVLRASGELDIATVPELLVDGDALLARDPYLVIDLRRVSFADATGVHALLRLHERAERLGGAVALAGARRAVLRVIMLTGLAERLDLQECVGCALLAHHDRRTSRR